MDMAHELWLKTTWCGSQDSGNGLAPSWLSVEFRLHDDVIRWKHFPCYWPFVRGIHRSPVNSLHKGQWRGALMFSLICARINGWVNNGEAGDLRRHRAHYDVTVMTLEKAWTKWPKKTMGFMWGLVYVPWQWNPSQFKIVEISICSYLNNDEPIAAGFCTRQDSRAVEACANKYIETVVMN